jgi:4,5-DOPA dioxygenase extradiol
VFTGHGSPMLALEDSEVTRELTRLGEQIVREFGKPPRDPRRFGPLVARRGRSRRARRIRAKSTTCTDSRTSSTRSRIRWTATPILRRPVQEALGSRVSVNDTWGHRPRAPGPCSCTSFPRPTSPSCSFSVDQGASAGVAYEIGQALEGLRDQGFLIVGSGNTVHNLGMIEWNNPDGTKATHQFNDAVW